MCREHCGGASYPELVEHHRRTVEQCGLSIMHVLGDHTGPPLTHTVGLTRQDGHPELVLTGLDRAVGHVVLGLLAQQVVHGLRLAAGDELRDLGVTPLRLLEVVEPEQLVVAQQLYRVDGAPPVPFLQVVWPDDLGRWPWEASPEWARRYELLGPPG